MSTQAFIQDRAGNMVDANSVSLPANRHFRDSWVKDPAAPVISVDMAMARQFYKRHADKAVEKFMRDVLVTKMLDADIANDDRSRQSVRKLRSDGKGKVSEQAIDAANTPEELEALWDRKTMGPPWWEQR